MPKPASPLQLHAVEAIRQAILADCDPAGPAIAKKKFPDVPPSTWSRWTMQARQQVADDDAAQKAAASTPARAVPAARLAANEGDGTRLGVINWVEQIGLMLRQCDTLARQSISVDPTTGVERVRNPLVLQQSIRARTMALKLGADREAIQYGAERTLFWERLMMAEIGRAIGKVRSEDQRVIANRVRRAVVGVLKRRDEERAHLHGAMSPMPETETEDSHDGE